MVDGIEVPFGALRKGPEFWRAATPELAEDEAFKSTIVGDIDRFILLSEVKRRRLMPSASEGMDFMEPHKAACLSNESCLNDIRGQGESLEDHWARVAPYFREDLGITRLHEALLTEAGLPPEKSTSNERAVALTEAVNQLRSNANIEWKDQRLADFYDQILSTSTQSTVKLEGSRRRSLVRTSWVLNLQ